jgi:predicted Zn-dependent protease
MKPLRPNISSSPSFSQPPLRVPKPQEAASSLNDLASPAFRWAKTDLPILWFAAPGFDRDFLEKAMAEWESASQGKLRFEAAKRTQDARLHFEWIDQSVIGRDYEVGHTNRRVEGGRILSAEISMMRHPIIDRHLSETQQKQRFYTTLLHELGHALGVEHSNNPEDVMYYRGWQNEHLSVQDIQRVCLLYATIKAK